MVTDAQSQFLYTGEVVHALDNKNRITIPSRWRRGEAEDFVLLPDAGSQFLVVLQPAEFARMSAQADSDPSRSPAERRMVTRFLHSRAQDASADKQGRLVLPDSLCQSLRLKGEVTLVGGRGRFEIWNRESRNEAAQAESAVYQRAADALGY